MGLEPGSTLERYEIVRLVGRGGMGEVYHATDTRLRRPVALKVLREDKDQSAETGTGGVARLLREARAAAAFNHPNSVAIYELGEADGVAYIAMELVLGESFRRHAQNPSITVETKLGWLVDAARALWAAHKTGVIHRDIKPSNIMVSEEGVVKVLDFGLAKPTPQLGEAGFQTVMGQVLGTPRYMAPEQLEGAPVDARVDQYAFGLTAYELLCGEYAGGPLAGSIRPLDEVTPAIPRELARIVSRMLSRHARDRYETMEQVAHELRACIPAVQDSVRRAAAAAVLLDHHDEEKTARDIGAAAKLATRARSDPGFTAPAPQSMTDPMRSLPTAEPPVSSPLGATVRMSAAPPLSLSTSGRSAEARRPSQETDMLGRPPTPATLPLARPLSSPLAPPQPPAIRFAEPAQPHGVQQTALSPAPLVVPTPPSVVSGVFPAGSAPASSPRGTNAPAHDPLHAAPSSHRTNGGAHAARGPSWPLIVAIVAVVALALGGGLALALR